AACTSLPVVTIPTTPSTAIPAAVWNHRIACVVLGPSFPSIVPALQPSAFSARWSDSTAAASLVLLAGAPKAADGHARTDAVTTAAPPTPPPPRARTRPSRSPNCGGTLPAVAAVDTFFSLRAPDVGIRHRFRSRTGMTSVARRTAALPLPEQGRQEPSVDT